MESIDDTIFMIYIGKYILGLNGFSATDIQSYIFTYLFIDPSIYK